MVLLILTPGAVRAIAEAREAAADELAELQRPGEPSLAEPAEGKPVSHSQLIDLSKLLKKHDIKVTEKGEEEGLVVYTLDHLLKGSKVYIPPPPPKKEPVRHIDIKNSVQLLMTTRPQNSKRSWSDSAAKRKPAHTSA
jgi:hypothetical protein